ncbi:MAG TPA: putative toxin-antitoxin system toxin component, PIN family [Gammaproteobacteria bacterium]|nr:putative toxin-antitoxin system toxin component, PIN family [Gammaproteobacteria bacterium]
MGGLWIVDTNVVVSGVIASDSGSPVAVILDRMLSAGIRFALCEELVAEYRDVLRRPRIQRLHSLVDDQVDQLLTALIERAVLADITTRTEKAPDPGDHHLWRLLAALPDSGLVTGDMLLIRNPPPDAFVLTPGDFLIMLDDPTTA